MTGSGLFIGVALVVGAYLAASSPTGQLVARSRGVDLRRVGSGNVGATNVLRALGPVAAGVVMLLDMGKGALPVVLARFLGQPVWLEVLAAIAAVAGHIWPLFQGFRGGKGVATAYGALLVLMPPAAVVALAIGLPIMAVTRYVSLGTLIGTAAGFVTLVVIVVLLGPWERLVYGSLALVVIVWRHRDNIRRLRDGTELRLSWPQVVSSGR